MLSNPLESPIFEILSDICHQKGVEAYVIGGFVRDYYLRRPCKDIDVVVVGSGIEIAKALGERLSTHVTIFKNFGTAMLAYDDLEIEFVGARKESYRSDSRKPIVEDGTIEDDRNRRDFTINAMAFSLAKDNFGELVDPFGGMTDLENITIRTPLDPDITFSDDPLRMLRAIRFASQLNFYIEGETFDAIKRNSQRMEIISKERIATELDKIMLSKRPSKGLRLLDEAGLIDFVVPELSTLKGVETRNGRSHKDNFDHTLKVVDNLAEYSDDLWLRYAALFHDIAKPRTKRWHDVAGWTFHGHEVVGAKMIKTIFKQMKLPMNEKMKFVEKMVLLHLRPIALVEDVVTDSAVRRLLFDAGDDVDALMMLCRADITSSNDAKVKRYMRNFELVKEKLVEIEEKDRVRNFQPPISGDIIMEYFGMEPCNEVGQIKMVIKDAILDGRITNDYDEAFALMIETATSMGIVKKNDN